MVARGFRACALGVLFCICGVEWSAPSWSTVIVDPGGVSARVQSLALVVSCVVGERIRTLALGFKSNVST